MSKVLEYFKGDELAASVWQGKYALKNKEGIIVEDSPADMHDRMAMELSRIESKYKMQEVVAAGKENLSDFGTKLAEGVLNLDVGAIYTLLQDFRYIVPQGSIMTMLGNPYAIGSLSNCFVVPSPYDSYGGILKTDEHLTQLMKRRGGVGLNLNTLRVANSIVSNAAGSSTGATSFMHRFSNTTREVAQNGRRGALMLLLSCLHPEIFDFVKIKSDKTKVTGANISAMLTDKFMQAAEANEDFYCRFPVELEDAILWAYPEMANLEYNKYTLLDEGVGVMKIHARELFDLIVEMAWDNAEPGLAFIDRILNYCPEGVYDQFKPIASNPCGEQWMQALDACRLLAVNLFSMIIDPFTENAHIDYDKVYEIFYLQQRLADDIVDLEIEYVDRIIAKIISDPEPDDVKATELKLWNDIKGVATASRRTGCGFTALGDMIAALSIAYDSEESMEVITKVMKTKMKAELDCTIDLAILRGSFEGADSELEFGVDMSQPANEWYKMVIDEFPEQAKRMYLYSRRNVSFSTVAPTGSVSILTQTTSGLEPLFLAWYMRRKKVNPSDGVSRVDFTDDNGDTWMEYPILHPKFKEWYDTDSARWWNDKDGNKIELQDCKKEDLEETFKESPWYGSCANDIDWVKRVEIQSILQKYTTNAISSTINLPNDVSKESVAEIYLQSWKMGLKGVTIYRDGCRTGVLVSEPKVVTNKFGYSDAVKRPKELEAELHHTTVKGTRYCVIVGLLNNNPYEVFAFQDSGFSAGKGLIIKRKKNDYIFLPNDETKYGVENLQDAPAHADEKVLTRLVSGMLRHGVNPLFIAEQINKSPLEVVSFGKALSRVLKNYFKEDDVKDKLKCPECGEKTLILEEGCSRCYSCGDSKCG